MKFFLFVAAVAMALAGCSTTTPAERMAAFEAKCDGYGFGKGTDAYSQCLMDLDVEHKRDTQRALDNAAQGLQNTGAQWSAMNPGSCRNRPNDYACGGY